MPREKLRLFPKHARLLERLGENLRLARKRRKLTTGQVAERAGISRSTLYHLERGAANSSLGTLLNVLVALKLEDDLALVGKDDVLGQRLMDAALLGKANKSSSRPATKGKIAQRISEPPQP